MSKLSRLLLTSLITVPLFFSAARATELKILGDDALAPALTKIGDEFGRGKDDHISFSFEKSPALAQRIIAGEAADVLVIQQDRLDALVKAGKIDPALRPVIGHIGLGLAGRSDETEPPILSTSAFLSVLNGADLVLLDDGENGDGFLAAIQRADNGRIAKNVVRVPLNEVLARVIRGTGHEIGVAPMNEILATQGVKVVGAVPKEFQSSIAYSAAPLSNGSQGQLAEEFVRYLQSPAAKGEFFGAGIN